MMTETTQAPIAQPDTSAVDAPSLLAFRRGLNTTHFALYGANSNDALSQRPLSVREEPLRGLNATHKTSGEEFSSAVLQVVETAELAPGEDTLVIKGAVVIPAGSCAIEACKAEKAVSTEAFEAAHARLLKAAEQEGDFAELAKRYAFQIASGSWGWRNADQAQQVRVEVTVGSTALSFIDLMFDLNKGFEPAAYPEHTQALKSLAGAIEAALLAERGRAAVFNVAGFFNVGVGARVYPSQEWSSSHALEKSKEKWGGKNSSGITRVLAKLALNKQAESDNHAIINDRKIGNALRTIDTWYRSSADGKVAPIAVEPYGANSHKNTAYRTGKNASIFGIVDKIVKGVEVTREQRLFYVAAVLRGGVYGQ